MTELSLRQAAVETGTSKSTILRAIQSGRLSAARTDDGGYAIQPAELFRVYPSRPQRSAAPAPGQDAPDPKLRTAELEAQVKALHEILAVERERSAEARADRDRWAEQAQRLALPAPARTGWLDRLWPRTQQA